jgi:acetyl esterase/lipase
VLPAWKDELRAGLPAFLEELGGRCRWHRSGALRGRLILLGEDASPQLRRSTSRDALVTGASPPFFIWHTAEDPYVPVEHTYRLAGALAAGDVPHAVHVFTHGPHSLGLAQGAGEPAIWTTLAKAWISERI